MDRRRSRVRVTALVSKRLQSAFLEAMQPLVRRLATDTVSPAVLRYVDALFVGKDKSCAFLHGFSSMPWHGDPVLFNRAAKLHKLLPILPVCTLTTDN